MILMEGAAEKSEEGIGGDGKPDTKLHAKGLAAGDVAREKERVERGEIPLGRMLRSRVRYFTDGAVIGSRSFVNEAFAGARERFGSKRKDGARKLRGSAAPAAMLWSARDLQKGVK
jgi:hypothetical protein